MTHTQVSGTHKNKQHIPHRSRKSAHMHVRIQGRRRDRIVMQENIGSTTGCYHQKLIHGFLTSTLVDLLLHRKTLMLQDRRQM